MKRQEFLKRFMERRTRDIKEAYKGDPHGVACSIASIIDEEKRAAKLWRKHRKALATESADAFFARIDAKESGGAN